MKVWSSLLAIVGSLSLFTGCLSTTIIKNSSEIGNRESVVIARVVRSSRQAPSPLVGPLDETYRSRKKINLYTGSANEYYICEVVSPGSYSLYTNENEQDVPSDRENRTFQETSGQSATRFPQSRFVRRNIVTFDVPSGKLVDLGVLIISPKGRVTRDKFLGRDYESRSWRFSIGRDPGNCKVLKHKYPDIFSNFAGKIHTPPGMRTTSRTITK